MSSFHWSDIWLLGRLCVILCLSSLCVIMLGMRYPLPALPAAAVAFLLRRVVLLFAGVVM